METILIHHDIKLLYVTASSFPDGVLAAHQQLHALLPAVEQRQYFGLSRPEADQGIVYKAAAEQMHPNEAIEVGLETFSLKQGHYVSLTIREFKKDTTSIGRAFRELLNQPGIDPDGYCVEHYLNEQDVNCLVRLMTS